MYPLSTIDKKITTLSLNPQTIITVNIHGGGGCTKAEAVLLQVLTMFLSAFFHKSTIFYVNLTKTISLDTVLFICMYIVRSQAIKYIILVQLVICDNMVHYEWHNDFSN